MDPDTIPDHAALREALMAPGAPEYMILDIGGSADLNGDGLVRVELCTDGSLEFTDV
jgi:hypothetical protein